MFEKVRMMELYIETLTGTAFELRVSPYETVHNVKTRIQKLEGIPISQQRLIWQNALELEDDYCLQDYGIHDGATLKLVLNMRGGPINTHKVPVDDPALREMVEYFSEANRDEFVERPSNRPVTVIVYHNGEQLNFFKIVDRDSASPLSESLSGASMGEEEDDDEDGGAPKEKVEENDKTREKMKELRSKMDNLTITKKPKKKAMVPRPPSSGRPASKARYWRTNSGKYSTTTINKTTCLPPLRQTLGTSATTSYQTEPSLGPVESSVADGVFAKTSELLQSGGGAAAATAATATAAPTSLPCSASHRRLEAIDSAKLKSTLSSVKENQNETAAASVASAAAAAAATELGSLSSKERTEDASEALGSILRKASRVAPRSNKTWDFSQEVLLKDSTSAAGSNSGAISKGDCSATTSAELPVCHKDPLSIPPPMASRGLERLLSQGSEGLGPGRPSVASSSTDDFTCSSSSRPGNASASKPSSKYGSERRQGVILESLNPSEVRAMSGMLNNIVRSANKSRAGFTLGGSNMGRTTPESRMMSARLQRLSASRDGRLLSPKHLPPVVTKKKKSSSKRCFVCTKKTGLATSYPCRCGHNYCASHRYPESHKCSIDYKTEGRKLLEQNNPVVSAPKLPKI